MVSFNFFVYNKAEILTFKQLNDHFVCLRVDFECEFFKILSNIFIANASKTTLLFVLVYFSC